MVHVRLNQSYFWLDHVAFSSAYRLRPAHNPLRGRLPLGHRPDCFCIFRWPLPCSNSFDMKDRHSNDPISQSPHSPPAVENDEDRPLLADRQTSGFELEQASTLPVPAASTGPEPLDRVGAQRVLYVSHGLSAWGQRMWVSWHLVLRTAWP